MLEIIVASLFIALISNIVLKKFALPTIIGYIVTGTIISYAFNLHDIVNNHLLKELAEFGIVFLMFTVGLEFSIKHLKAIKYEVFVLGSLQILATMSVVFICSFYLFGLDKNSSLIISMAVAMSSTAIVLKSFNETGEINKKFGRNSLGILIMQDIAVIPILIFIGILSSSESSLRDITLQLLLHVLILVLIFYFAAKYLLEPFFTQILKTHSDELFVGSILFLAIGASYIANSLGFSYSLGALIAGMLIAETKYKHQAEVDLIPFRDLLLGVFFITVGMQIKFGIIVEYIHIILNLLVVITIIKFMIVFLLVKIKDDKRTTIKTAFALIQIGEFALAILELARLNSLIEAPYGQVMIVVVVISMVLTPIILKNLGVLADLFLSLNRNIEDITLISEEIKDHIVVLGYGEFGESMANRLKSEGKLYIVVENNIDRYHQALQNKESTIFGNAANKEILKKAFAQNADKVIVTIDNPKKLYSVCHEVQKIVHKDKIIVKVHSRKEKEDLEHLGILNIIVENDEVGDAILNYI